MIYLRWRHEKRGIRADSWVSTICLVVALTKLVNPEGTEFGGKCFQCA